MVCNKLSIFAVASVVKPMVFFDFEIDDMPLGGVSFELSTDYVPKTSGSTGEKGSGPKGCCYLRVVLVFMRCHMPCWH